MLSQIVVTAMFVAVIAVIIMAQKAIIEKIDALSDEMFSLATFNEVQKGTTSSNTESRRKAYMKQYEKFKRNMKGTK